MCLSARHVFIETLKTGDVHVPEINIDMCMRIIFILLVVFTG